mmetsp:Transcript_30304/g.73743  ORF Transcript_30304/g.73743 Transcript_30304/m.73743 type:complete len:393 (-) Transcript_30304:465-1643(-)
MFQGHKHTREIYPAPKLQELLVLVETELVEIRHKPRKNWLWQICGDNDIIGKGKCVTDKFKRNLINVVLNTGWFATLSLDAVLEWFQHFNKRICNLSLRIRIRSVRVLEHRRIVALKAFDFSLEAFDFSIHLLPVCYQLLTIADRFVTFGSCLVTLTFYQIKCVNKTRIYSLQLFNLSLKFGDVDSVLGTAVLAFIVRTLFSLRVFIVRSCFWLKVFIVRFFVIAVSTVRVFTVRSFAVRSFFSLIVFFVRFSFVRSFFIRCFFVRFGTVLFAFFARVFFFVRYFFSADRFFFLRVFFYFFQTSDRTITVLDRCFVFTFSFDNRCCCCCCSTSTTSCDACCRGRVGTCPTVTSTSTSHDGLCCCDGSDLCDLRLASLVLLCSLVVAVVAGKG